MTLEYKNYGTTDNSNLKVFIKLLVYILIFFFFLGGLTFVLKTNTEPKIIIKKEEPITTLAKELEIINKTVEEKNLLHVKSNENFIIVKIKKNTSEKKYLPLLVRYENFINIMYNNDNTVELQIKKEVFKK